jgi:phosphate transport system permease protein
VTRPRDGGAMRRRMVNRMVVATTYLFAVLTTVPLLAILSYLVVRGASSLSVGFLTHSPRPAGEPGGGMGNALVGTVILLLIACGVGLPIGIGAGLYLAERPRTVLSNAVRFLADVLNGQPSIVMGIFTWQLLVRPMQHISAHAGGVALGMMMIPMVARTTEEMLRLVPASLREAAIALGYTRWRTSITVVLRTATGGIVTGALVAMARVAGETAPLLFTAFGNQFWSVSLGHPIAALPLQIFNYAIAPYDDWNAQAWAGAIVLLAFVFVVSLGARFATRRRHDVGE